MLVQTLSLVSHMLHYNTACFCCERILCCATESDVYWARSLSWILLHRVYDHIYPCSTIPGVSLLAIHRLQPACGSDNWLLFGIIPEFNIEWECSAGSCCAFMLGWGTVALATTPAVSFWANLNIYVFLVSLYRDCGLCFWVAITSLFVVLCGPMQKRRLLCAACVKERITALCICLLAYINTAAGSMLSSTGRQMC